MATLCAPIRFIVTATTILMFAVAAANHGFGVTDSNVSRSWGKKLRRAHRASQADGGCQ
jgi:hypothetical protein